MTGVSAKKACFSQQLRKVSLDPSKRQMECQKTTTAQEKPQKPTLKPKPATESQKPSVAVEKVRYCKFFPNITLNYILFQFVVR